MTGTNAVFKAIAHPARRQIISMLAKSNCSVKQLTSAFTMSQPAVSQHLRELKAARLATSDKVGLEQIYRLTAEPLRLIFEWSGKYKRFFDTSGHAWEFMPTPASSGRRKSGR